MTKKDKGFRLIRTSDVNYTYRTIIYDTMLFNISIYNLACLLDHLILNRASNYLNKLR